MSRNSRSAEGQAVDDALASANPYHRSDIGAALPGGLHDAVVREIIDGADLTFRDRIAARIDALLAPAPWGRVGFVGVLAAVVIAALAVNPGLIGQEADVAEPAQVGEAAEPVPQDNGQPETVVVEPAPTTSSDVDQPQESSSDSEDPAEEDSVAEEPVSDGSATETEVEPESDEASVSEQAYEGEPSAVVGFGEPTVEPLDPQTDGNDGECVVVVAEDLSLTGAWRLVSDDAAVSGAYVVWEGLEPGEENDAPADVLTASIEIDTAGTYRFVWSMRQPNDGAGDVANDSWLNFPDADRFGPIEGGSYNGFVKVYGNSKDQFTWTATADEGQVKTQIAVHFSQPGTYTMELAGRSHGHQLDSIVLYQDSLSRNDAVNDRCD